MHFLVADPRKEKIGEAIQAMEDLVKGADATPDDYFDLAKLYLKKGDWTSYDNRMHSVLGAQKGVVQPGLPRLLHQYAPGEEGTRRRGQLAEDLGEEGQGEGEDHVETGRRSSPTTSSTRCG